AASRFADTCLRQDGSLFTPGEPIWTLAHARAAQGRVATPDLSTGTFIGKLRGQVEDLQPAEVQLAAELLYVQLLPESDTGGDKKKEHVSAILAMLPEPVQMPSEF